MLHQSVEWSVCVFNQYKNQSSYLWESQYWGKSHGQGSALTWKSKSNELNQEKMGKGKKIRSAELPWQISEALNYKHSMAKNKLNIFYENHNFHMFCSIPKKFHYFLINDLNLTSWYSLQFTLIFQAFFSPLWVMKSTTWESNKFWIMKKALHMQSWFNHSLFFKEKQNIRSPSLQDI